MFTFLILFLLSANLHEDEWRNLPVSERATMLKATNLPKSCFDDSLLVIKGCVTDSAIVNYVQKAVKNKTFNELSGYLFDFLLAKSDGEQAENISELFWDIISANPQLILKNRNVFLQKMDFYSGALANGLYFHSETKEEALDSLNRIIQTFRERSSLEEPEVNEFKEMTWVKFEGIIKSGW